jgi:hypothetical protein
MPTDENQAPAAADAPKIAQCSQSKCKKPLPAGFQYKQCDKCRGDNSRHKAEQRKRKRGEKEQAANKRAQGPSESEEADASSDEEKSADVSLFMCRDVFKSASTRSKPY